MGTTNSITRRVGFAVVMAISMVWARPALAIEYFVSYPSDIPTGIPIMPGEAGVFVFDVQSLSVEAGTALVSILPFSGYGPFVIDQGQPSQCGNPAYVSSALTFPVALVGGQSRRCTYRLTRSAASMQDLAMRLCTGLRSNSSPCSYPDSNLTPFYAGFIPDIGIISSEISPVMQGAVESVIRLTATNPSTVATRAIDLYTPCSYSIPVTPYMLDDQLEGACPIVRITSCTPFGVGIPPPGLRWQVQLSAVPAMAQSSCLVRMRFNAPLATSVSDTLSIGFFGPPASIPLALGTNFYGYDPNPANDTTPFGAVLPSVAVPIGDKVTWILLCGTLVGIAWRRRTRIRATLGER